MSKAKSGSKSKPTTKKASAAPRKAAAKPSSSGKTAKAATSKATAKKPVKKNSPGQKQPAANIATKSPARSASKAISKAASSTKKETLVGTTGGDKKKKQEIVLDPSYRPSEDEPFMNERQRAYFRNKLKTWKEDIIRQTRETLAGLHEDSTQHADLADRATSETDRALELRARDRQRKLINKIDAALARIEDGSYGYCEETGEPIGLKRLDARPIATLSVEAQERHERRERVYRED